MNLGNKRLVKAHIDLSWNKGKFNLSQKMVDNRFRYQETFKDGFRNIEGYRDYVEYVEKIRRAVPDLEVTVEEIMAEGDKVITFSTVFGSFNHRLFDTPPNGKIIVLSVASVWFVHLGKIIEQTTMIDLLDLQRQLNA
jgi:steroid delta-isomerase-like uncharacterized protein